VVVVGAAVREALGEALAVARGLPDDGSSDGVGSEVDSGLGDEEGTGHSSRQVGLGVGLGSAAAVPVPTATSRGSNPTAAAASSAPSGWRVLGTPRW
jgi:hypothetical protein